MNVNTLNIEDYWDLNSIENYLKTNEQGNESRALHFLFNQANLFVEKILNKKTDKYDHFNIASLYGAVVENDLEINKTIRNKFLKTYHNLSSYDLKIGVFPPCKVEAGFRMKKNWKKRDIEPTFFGSFKASYIKRFNYFIGQIQDGKLDLDELSQFLINDYAEFLKTDPSENQPELEEKMIEEVNMAKRLVHCFGDFLVLCCQNLTLHEQVNLIERVMGKGSCSFYSSFMLAQLFNQIVELDDLPLLKRVYQSACIEVEVLSYALVFICMQKDIPRERTLRQIVKIHSQIYNEEFEENENNIWGRFLETFEKRLNVKSDVSSLLKKGDRLSLQENLTLDSLDLKTKTRNYWSNYAPSFSDWLKLWKLAVKINTPEAFDMFFALMEKKLFEVKNNLTKEEHQSTRGKVKEGFELIDLWIVLDVLKEIERTGQFEQAELLKCKTISRVLEVALSITYIDLSDDVKVYFERHAFNIILLKLKEKGFEEQLKQQMRFSTTQVMALCYFYADLKLKWYNYMNDIQIRTYGYKSVSSLNGIEFMLSSFIELFEDCCKQLDLPETALRDLSKLDDLHSLIEQIYQDMLALDLLVLNSDSETNLKRQLKMFFLLLNDRL